MKTQSSAATGAKKHSVTNQELPDTFLEFISISETIDATFVPKHLQPATILKSTCSVSTSQRVNITLAQLARRFSFTVNSLNVIGTAAAQERQKSVDGSNNKHGNSFLNNFISSKSNTSE